MRQPTSAIHVSNLFQQSPHQKWNERNWLSLLAFLVTGTNQATTSRMSVCTATVAGLASGNWISKASSSALLLDSACLACTFNQTTNQHFETSACLPSTICCRKSWHNYIFRTWTRFNVWGPPFPSKDKVFSTNHLRKMCQGRNGHQQQGHQSDIYTVSTQSFHFWIYSPEARSWRPRDSRMTTMASCLAETPHSFSYATEIVSATRNWQHETEEIEFGLFLSFLSLCFQSFLQAEKRFQAAWDIQSPWI